MLTCPVYVDIKIEGMRQTKIRQPCGKPATNYEVQGESFSCYQILCHRHAERARKEGFRLFELKEN